MESQTIPFDLHRVFLGDEPPLFLLEVVFRTFVMYSYTLLAARFIGKRGMGQLTPFEFVVVIVLGSAVGDPMLYPDVPLFHGIAVVTLIVLMQKLLNSITNKSHKIEDMVESSPRLLIKDGKELREAIEDEGMSDQEFHMQLRCSGVRNIGEVEAAYLEPSGKLSVFKYRRGEERKGTSTIPKTERQTPHHL